MASALLYIVATLVLGREVLGQLASRVLSDAGDPLLTAAILKWNATHVPLTDAWWQFPIFFPTRNALAFSEHLLGISVVASPLEWITGNPLVTYNLVTLLTFPLCATAMYALVYRLTRSAAGAFVAGIAFGFAPYRISQLPHVQMLASFYIPLALLGLHEYVESGRRRWLALYAACWMLQGMANGYCVFFFSVLVGLWGLWFVVARARWRAVVDIVIATAIAAVPLAAVLSKYVAVHAFHGFARSVDEIQSFSADVAGVLCAPEALSVWGWVRVACRAEGELFPGVAVFVLFVIAIVRVLGWPRQAAVAPASRPVAVAARLGLIVGIVYTIAVLIILIVGPIRLDAGLLHFSLSSVRKAGTAAVLGFVIAMVLTPPVRRGVQHSSTLAFYVAAALLTWVFALGPTITGMGRPTDIHGPFAWLMMLPGADSLRVPARFWLMTITCLSVVAGIVVAELLKERPWFASPNGWRRTIAIAVIACAVFADGAVNRLRSDPAPPPLPNEQMLAGSRVMFLPLEQNFDIASTYRAVAGGWTAVNGYSGYEPIYDLAISAAVRAEDPELFTPFQRYGPLDVVVSDDAPRLKALAAQQPGAVVVAHGNMLTQYRLPAKPVTPAVTHGQRVSIRGVTTDCGRGTQDRATDGNLATAWLCPQTADVSFTIDLGQVDTVGSIVTELGGFVTEYPRHLVVQTSADGETWQEAWSGSTLAPLVWGAVDHPKSLPIGITFTPTMARFIRLRQNGRDPKYAWGIAELQVYSR